MKKFIITLIFAMGIVILTSSAKDKQKPFSVKLIENSISKVGEDVNEKLYASKYETSNFLYVTFLEDLKQSGLMSKYDKAQIILPKDNKQKINKNDYLNSSFSNYPIVNISYEGAVLFCEWLTEKYNSSEKRKYKKVLFKLPTKEEWEKAARGGLKSVSYPWGGFSLENKQGCSLCNYYKLGSNAIHFNKATKQYEVITDIYTPQSESFLHNGGLSLCKVSDYPPNNYRLYNMSGNVKEMIAQKGIAKGGSYLSTGYDVRIQSEDTYDRPMNDLGFRYFMIVIEE